MKKKLEEKILEEIRKIVIEKDIKHQSQNEVDEMRKANIEALTELTSLSKEEVEKIAGSVRASYIIEQKRKQKRNIRIGIILGIVAVIAFFIFKPKPEPIITIVEDKLDENINNWDILEDYKIRRIFRNNQYHYYVNKDEWCYWDNAELEFPKNYDVEVHSEWLGGKYDGYGLALTKSNTSYYAFRLKANGEINYGKVVDKEWVIDDGWKENIAKKGKNQINKQKIEVRGENFKYYVNDNLAKEGKIDFEINNLALRACGEQKIAFTHVKITNTKTNEIVFEDNFNPPSDKWSEKDEAFSESYFQNGDYVLFYNKNDKCTWSASSLRVSDNCEITIKSKWLTGETSTYGVMIMHDDNNYFAAELQNNGEARLIKYEYSEYSYVQNYVRTNAKGEGNQSVTQKILIKDGEIFYYVNDLIIDQQYFDLESPCTIAFRLCDEQTIAFEDVKIKYIEEQ